MNASVSTFSRMRLVPIFSVASTGEAETHHLPPPGALSNTLPGKRVGGRGWINLHTCLLHHQVAKNTGKNPLLLQNVVNVKNFLKEKVFPNV